MAGWDRRYPGIFTTVVCLIALALRLPHYASRPVWYDEAEQFFISSAHTPGATLQRLVEGDRNPPGFALLVHAI